MKDIHPGAARSLFTETRFIEFVEVGSLAFFSANDGTNGTELWRSDGTSAGTTRVKDIFPGSGSSAPSNLTNVNGTLFFTASDGATGAPLWKSNGTEAGTVRVTDSDVFDSARQLTNVNGTLFFSAHHVASGQELWKSNGTDQGTIRVKDIVPGSGWADPFYLTNVNGTVFFSAKDSNNDRELWKSDGSEAGTTRVKDILPGTIPGVGGSNPAELTNVNGTLFFRANNGTNGVELWKSDGTLLGTTVVKDIRVGSNGSFPNQLTNVNGTLFFNAFDDANESELWKTNGAAAGTVRVKDIRPGTAGSIHYHLTNVNGTLFFQANDGTNPNSLWKSDGTASTTSIVKVIQPGTSFNSGLSNLINVNGTLYFFAEDDTNGRELWKSDGTTTGTILVSDIRSGSYGSFPPFGYLTFSKPVANVNGTLFFVADNGINGAEPWVLRPDSNNANLAIAASSANKNEGNSGTTAFAFTVTRTGALTGATTVNYDVTGTGVNPATATDFFGNAFPSGTVSFAAGETSKVISVRVRGDVTIEQNEGFRVTLSSPSSGATVTTSVASGLIRNDDASLAIAATSASKNEGNSGFTSFTFTVTRTGALTGTTTVSYVVAGNGANPAQATDFFGNVFSSGTVTFAAGETTKVISVRVRGDVTIEQSEGFRVTLSNPSGGATITTAVASGLIRNDDTSLAIAATSASKNEGNSGFTSFTFTVTRTGAVTGTTTVDYVVAGNGANPAQATDFFGNVFPSGTVTFAPGEMTQLISIRVRGDATVEPTEGLRVTLSNPSLGASLATSFASGTIRNDD